MPTDGAQQTDWSVPHERPSERARTRSRKPTSKRIRGNDARLASDGHGEPSGFDRARDQPTPDQRRLERRRCDPMAESRRA